MKKTNWKRTTMFWVLAVMMLISMTACQPPATNDPTTTQAPGTAPTEKEPEKPVEFSIMLLAPADFSPDNNAWVDAVNEKANAKIEWIANAAANIWEKRNTVMASQSYPDVIIMNTTSKGLNDNLYNSMVEHKIILPLDDYIANTENIMKYTNQQCWDAVRDPDGSVYMVPRSTIIREDFMANRKDWREALGKDIPVTIDDWRDLYKAIAAGDPDKNGSNDTYGVTESSEMMNLNGTINLEFFARAWNADKNWYVGEDGKIFNGMFAQDGRFKYALEFYKNLNDDGSLDPDFITNKGIIDKQERVRKGDVSSIRLFAGNLDRELNTLRTVDQNAEFELVMFPASNTPEVYAKEKLVSTNAGLYNAWALTTTAKGKEQRIIDVFDWMLSDEGWDTIRIGVEGVHYEKEGDKIVNKEPEFGLFSKWIGYLQMFRRPNDEALWLKNVIPEYYSYQKEWLNKSIEFMNTYDQKGLIGVQIPEETEFYKKDIYTTEFPTLCVEIIYGEKPLSAWDDFITRVYNEGWQEVTDLYNDYYQSNK